MTATFFPSIVGTIRTLFRLDNSAPPQVDQNDPAFTTDRMGIRCKLHDCPRCLDEAPLVPIAEHDMSFQAVKQRSFPNTWMAMPVTPRPLKAAEF